MSEASFRHLVPTRPNTFICGANPHLMAFRALQAIAGTCIRAGDIVLWLNGGKVPVGTLGCRIRVPRRQFAAVLAQAGALELLELRTNYTADVFARHLRNGARGRDETSPLLIVRPVRRSAVSVPVEAHDDDVAINRLILESGRLA